MVGSTRDFISPVTLWRPCLLLYSLVILLRIVCVQKERASDIPPVAFRGLEIGSVVKGIFI